MSYQQSSQNPIQEQQLGESKQQNIDFENLSINQKIEEDWFEGDLKNQNLEQEFVDVDIILQIEESINQSDYQDVPARFCQNKINLASVLLSEIVDMCLSHNLIKESIAHSFMVNHGIAQTKQFLRLFKGGELQKYKFQKCKIELIDHRRLTNMLLNAFPERYTFEGYPFELLPQAKELLKSIYQLEWFKYEELIQKFQEEHKLTWWNDEETIPQKITRDVYYEYENFKRLEQKAALQRMQAEQQLQKQKEKEKQKQKQKQKEKEKEKQNSKNIGKGTKKVTIQTQKSRNIMEIAKKVAQNFIKKKNEVSVNSKSLNSKQSEPDPEIKQEAESNQQYSPKDERRKQKNETSNSRNKSRNKKKPKSKAKHNKNADDIKSSSDEEFKIKTKHGRKIVHTDN